jgi:hypothetical protein
MRKWQNYQFLKKRVAGERTPSPGYRVVPCLADASRTVTRVWTLGGGKKKKMGVRLFRVIGRRAALPRTAHSGKCRLTDCLRRGVQPIRGRP